MKIFRTGTEKCVTIIIRFLEGGESNHDTVKVSFNIIGVANGEKQLHETKSCIALLKVHLRRKYFDTMCPCATNTHTSFTRDIICFHLIVCTGYHI